MNNHYALHNFTGKVALITGAASGIGHATAVRLAARGARLCLADIDQARLEQTAARISENGAEVVHRVVDVTSEADNRAMVDLALSSFGQLDVAHLNAGILHRQGVLDSDFEAWKKVIDINLSGIFLGLRACADPMREHGGAIVVTASASGLFGSADMAAYTASKHGVLGLMKCAALELAAFGIRVNAISPGAVYTDMLVVQGTLEEINASALAKTIALKRVAEASEIAELACFLLCDAASYMTGGIYPVDGGVSASGIPIRRN